MEQAAAEQKVRRLVTGHDAQGRSVIVSDTTAVMERPLHELWVTHGTPARFGDAPNPGTLPMDLEPPTSGTVVRLVRFMPSQGMSRDDMERLYTGGFAAINATHTRVDTQRHPAMHRTRTLDYGIVLAGTIKLLMDDGEQELKPFDVVIQRGTNHGWVNPGSEPALMAFMLIDGAE